MTRTIALLVLMGCAGAGKSDRAETSDTADSDAEGGGQESADPGPDFDCPVAMTGLQDITTTPASPYLVRHPTAVPEDKLGDIVVFLAGGPGDSASASYAFNSFLGTAEQLNQIWGVMPYTEDGSLSDEGDRVVAVVEEILACYGGDPDRAHLAGTSNGGRAAFTIMLEHPETFNTLLGAPGYFTEPDTSVWAAALADKAVFNGVGEEDDESWREVVLATHESLLAVGVDSTYNEFAGQGHVPNADFDSSTLFAFWNSH